MLTSPFLVGMDGIVLVTCNLQADYFGFLPIKISDSLAKHRNHRHLYTANFHDIVEYESLSDYNRRLKKQDCA